MLYFDRIVLSEGIDLAKSNNCRECIVCHYWFVNHWLEFQNSVCNSHDLMFCLNISDNAIITVKGVDYRCTIHAIIKSDAVHFLENFVLDDLGRALTRPSL